MGNTTGGRTRYQALRSRLFCITAGNTAVCVADAVCVKKTVKCGDVQIDTSGCCSEGVTGSAGAVWLTACLLRCRFAVRLRLCGMSVARMKTGYAPYGKRRQYMSALPVGRILAGLSDCMPFHYGSTSVSLSMPAALAAATRLCDCFVRLFTVRCTRARPGASFLPMISWSNGARMALAAATDA